MCTLVKKSSSMGNLNEVGHALEHWNVSSEHAGKPIQRKETEYFRCLSY